LFILFKKERTKKSGAKEKIPTRYRRKFLNDLTFASLTKSFFTEHSVDGYPAIFSMRQYFLRLWRRVKVKDNVAAPP